MKVVAFEGYDHIRSKIIIKRKTISFCKFRAMSQFNVLLKILIFSTALQCCFAATIMNLVAGTGYTGSTGSGGAATAALINNPKGIWSDSLGGVYIAEKSNGCTRKVTTSNILVDFAGQCSNTASTATDGGPASSTRFSSPVSVVGDTTGVVYISDTSSSRIRSVSTSGIVGAVGGIQGASSNYGDGGKATAAGINDATGLAYSTSGLLYIISTDGVLRVISLSAGFINLVAGTFLLNDLSLHLNFAQALVLLVLLAMVGRRPVQRSMHQSE